MRWGIQGVLASLNDQNGGRNPFQLHASLRINWLGERVVRGLRVGSGVCDGKAFPTVKLFGVNFCQISGKSHPFRNTFLQFFAFGVGWFCSCAELIKNASTGQWQTLGFSFSTVNAG